MTPSLDAVGGFQHETVEFEPASPATLRVRGTIAIHDPNKHLQPYLRKVHAAALEDKVSEFEVDVVALTFVNSSAIRLFIDWAMWVADGERPYLLVFRTDPRSTWQRSAFAAIRALAGDAIRVVS